MPVLDMGDYQFRVEIDGRAGDGTPRSYWTVRLFEFVDSGSDDIEDQLAFSFDLIRFEGDATFDDYDEESQETAILFHLLFRPDGTLMVDCDSPDFPVIYTVLLVDTPAGDFDRPELFVKALRWVVDLFGDHVLPVVTPAEHYRLALAKAGFKELVPPQLVAENLMPDHDMRHLAQTLDAMRRDPRERWMWNDNCFKWRPRRSKARP